MRPVAVVGKSEPSWIQRTLDELYEDVLLRVNKLLPESADRLDLDPKDEPNDMDTLGSLIDKLITVDMKMWHNQELLYAIRKMSPSEFGHAYGHRLDELHKIIQRCCDLNVQRSRLMDAIDIHFAAVTRGDREPIVAEQHKTY